MSALRSIVILTLPGFVERQLGTTQFIGYFYDRTNGIMHIKRLLKLGPTLIRVLWSSIWLLLQISQVLKSYDQGY